MVTTSSQHRFDLPQCQQLQLGDGKSRRVAECTASTSLHHNTSRAKTPLQVDKVIHLVSYVHETIKCTKSHWQQATQTTSPFATMVHSRPPWLNPPGASQPTHFPAEAFSCSTHFPAVNPAFCSKPCNKTKYQIVTQQHNIGKPQQYLLQYSTIKTAPESGNKDSDTKTQFHRFNRHCISSATEAHSIPNTRSS